MEKKKAIKAFILRQVSPHYKGYVNFIALVSKYI